MKELKKMVRKNEKPLQQVVKRYKEQQNVNTIIYLKDNDQLKLKVKEPDCYVLTYNGTIVKIKEFLPDNEVFVGHAFTSKEDMFMKPMKSSKFDIFVVKNLSVNSSQWKISDMWTVILFKDDSTLAAVPEFWFRNGSCAWPNKYSTKYIERRKQPNELEFKQYKAKVLLKNIGPYLEARKFAEENSEASSLDNVYEDTRKKKIQHSKTLRNDQISSPPKLQSDESINENEDYSDSGIDKTVKPFNIQDSPNSLMNSSLTHTFEHENTAIGGYNVDNSSKYKKSQQIDLTPRHGNTLPEVPIKPYEINNDQLQTFMKFTSCALTNMKYENEGIQKRLDIITTLIEKTNEKLDNSVLFSTNHTLNNIADYDNDIPCINSNDELKNAEDNLTDNRQYRAELIVSLMRLMGNDVSETVRRIMQKMFTDKFLAGYSFIGFKGKQQFSTLQSCTVIFESIHKMKKYKDTPTKDIEKSIKGWLAQAPTRIKKQAEKKKYK
ncbi:hypothetical protein QTP88_022798 [Uroleucon formosanum]